MGPFALLVTLIAASALAYGFGRRDDNWITPEHGLGYLLGIIGTALMVILLSYPLRKRMRGLRGWGKLPNWLNVHMMLGIFGPTLVILHTNFRTGATNSAVALFTMLIVVASGVVGRYIYGKTHNRLTGELRDLRDLRSEMAAARTELGFDISKVPGLSDALDDLDARVLAPDYGLLASLSLAAGLSWSKTGERRRLLSLVEPVLARSSTEPARTRQTRKAVNRYLAAYVETVSRAAGFRFYERVFALWHVLHVPLLFLLIAATAVHVAAVHLY